MPRPPLYEIVLPRIALPVPDSTKTPRPAFRAMTFLVPGTVPPIVFPLASACTSTPLPPLGRAADAVAFVPMKLPCSTLPVVVASTKRTPLFALPEMTLRSAPGPPIVLSSAPSLTWTPSARFGIATAMPASTPIRLPLTTLPEAPVRRRTPFVPLPDTTLPGPTVFPVEPETMMPFRTLPIAAEPGAFVPTKFPATVLPAAPLISSIPEAPLPETTLPGPIVAPVVPPRSMPCAWFGSGRGPRRVGADVAALDDATRWPCP